MATSETLDIQDDIIGEIKDLVSYLYFIYREGDKQELEVSELRKRLVLTKEEFDQLKNELDNINTRLTSYDKELKHINIETALSRKRITDIKNEIFSFSRLKDEINQFTIKLTSEYENIETTYSSLTNKKETLIKTIEAQSLSTKQYITKMADDLSKISGMKESLITLSEEKKAVSTDIERRLSKTSLDRDEIEKELFELNQRLIRFIEERQEVNKVLEEIDQPVKGIRDEVERLKGEWSILQDLKDIPGTKQSVLDKIARLEIENKEKDIKIAETKKQTGIKHSENDALIIKNIERRKTLSALEEEIGVFEKVYSDWKNTGRSIEELQRTKEDTLQKMEETLNIDLADKLLEMEEAARVLVKEKALI